MSADEKIHEALTDEGRGRLARMHPGQNCHDALPPLLELALLRRYRDKLDLSLLHRVRQQFALRRRKLCQQIVQVARAATVRVRISQDELVNVVLAVEGESEAQDVVVLVLSGFVVKNLK